MTTPRPPTDYRCPKCGTPYSPAVGCPREVSLPPLETAADEAPCNVRISRQTLSRAAPPALRRLAAWLHVHVAATPCDCGRCQSELLERLARVRGFC